MLSTSQEFHNLISQNSKVLMKADLTLADGTTEQLAGDDFMMGSAAFSDAVSSSGSFDIGAAIINSLRVSLNNYDGRFDDYDFTDATIVPYVGVQLSGGTVEWLRKGVYGVEQPRTYGTIISISALDNMRKLERPYSDVSTTYPATLQTIVRDICSTCGVTLVNPDFANGSYVVAERPDDSSLTCVAALAYAAQASGNWARCDEWGRMRLAWYDTDAFEDESEPYAHITAFSSAAIATDDVVITGLRVTAQDGEDQDGETYLYGNEGYVLEIPDNPLVLCGQAHAVAAQVGLRVVGMRFRPLDLSALGDPALEAGDPILVTDGQQREYRSYLTSLTYKVGAYEAMACDAETPSRNRAASYSALTRAVVGLRNAVKEEHTEREQSIADLAEQLASSSGLYMTTQPQQDGSTIYYMHDKPTLAESTVVWKLTANAFGISTDGGRTYPYGLDVSGTAILNRIYAVGINADYIDSGALTVRDGGTTVLSADADTGVVVLQDASGNMWNLHTGELRMAATSQMGGRTAQEILAELDATITAVDVEYAQNQSSTTAPTSGWQTTAPTWREGYYIWQRTATTTAAGTTYSAPTCISGRDGASGTNASTLYLYQRASSAPAKPSGTLTYTFATGELSGNLGSWTRGIPDGTETCWVIVATAISNSTTDTIASSEWSDPTELASGGTDGLNQATIYLHKRSGVWRTTSSALVAPSASAFSVSGTTATIDGTVSGTTLTLAVGAPAAPSGTLTYTFANGALSGNLEGWSRSVPDGDDPCWVTTACAISSEATDTIAPAEWAEVVKLAEDGISPTTESVAYAVSASGESVPEVGWQATVPVVAQGMWLWSRTTYSDGSTLVTCSYMGTDGQDGNSVAVQSVTKAGGVTTVVLASTDGTTETLTIADGEDGPEGIEGDSGYVHVAWATSADGTQGFSTTVSADKTYIGVYTDHTAADSTRPSDYSWSKIKGETGTGVSAVVEQYYLSTSKTTQTGGSWSTTQPAWVEGKYIWTRSAVTWTDGTTTYTSPVLAQAVNSANERANEAAGAVSALDESLTQQEIFNRLTNNGETQGIYLQSGKLYINGTYIQTGTINANLIKAGALTVSRNGTTVFSANLETGVVSISGDCITVGSESVTQAVSGIRATYGTCSTGAGTAAKVVTCENFTLRTGSTVEVKFTNANTASSPTLNVNGTGAKAIQLNGSAIPQSAWWGAGQTMRFVYDGSAWCVSDGATVAQVVSNTSSISTLTQTAQGFEASITSHTTTLNQLKATYGTCATDGATVEKAVTCENFSLRTGAMVSVKFSNANTASNPKLNVNGTGAKNIRLNGSNIPQSAWWGAGQTMTFTYDGTYWLVTDGAALAQVVSNTSDIATIVARADTIEASVSGVKASYGTCSTEADTQLKEVTIDGFEKFTGQTVTVRFSYANTASSPRLKVQNSDGSKYATGYIYVNNSYMNSDNYWAANGVVTFVWDGSAWRVGDGSTLSKIKLLKDSLELSVTNGSLGNTASIKLMADDTQLGSASLNLSGVRNAFKNDTTAITITAGTVTFNSGTFVVNSTYFSVTSTGVITATSGTIGGFTIASSKLYSSKSSLTANTSGVYVGTDGISVGSGSEYMALAGGYLRGGNSSTITGYVGFNNYWTDSGVYGTRLAGRGCICLLTNGPFGIGSYYSFGSDATITTGESGTLKYVEKIQANSDGTITWWTSSIKFTKGLMVTDI